METGKLYRPDNEELLEIKNGEWTLGQIKQEADKLFEESQEAYQNSPLPEKPDKNRAEELLVDIIRSEALA